MKARYFLPFLCLLFLLCAPCVAQPRLKTPAERTPNYEPLETEKSPTEPSTAKLWGNPALITSFRLDVRSGLGYETISPGAEVEALFSLTDRIKLDASGYFSRSKKVVDQGHSFGGAGQIRGYLNEKTFLLAGMTARNQQTDSYSKLALSPIVGIGQTRAPFQYRIFAELPDLTSPNKVKGIGARFEYFAPSRKRWGFYVSGEPVMRFYKCYGPLGLTENCSGVNATIKFGVYFKQREK